MTKAKQKAALQFMFAHISEPIWWQSRALTKTANPVADSPDLNAAEAESVFRLLATKDLIFPAINPANEPCFLLHSAKEPEWKELITPPSFLKHNWRRVLLSVGALFLWLSSVIISTWLTKSVEGRVDDINKVISELREQIKAN